MPPPQRKEAVATWPFEQLITVLLKQFKRLLDQHGIKLTEADVNTIAAQITARAVPDERIVAIREVLAALVGESETVLTRWGLTYEQALNTGMDAMPGWETTADFLELADQKMNAELRISAASALVSVMGDTSYIQHLHTLIKDDHAEETVIAHRVLDWLKDTPA